MSPTEPTLVVPHGGRLLDLTAPAAAAAALHAEAADLPSVILDERERADLELLGNGAYSPLAGFLGRSDYASVLQHLRLADGTVWPLPVTLSVDERLAERLHPGARLALRDEDGTLRAVLTVDEVYLASAQQEARQVYGTSDATHPGVAYLLQRSPWLVGGAVQVLPVTPSGPLAARCLTPRQLRNEIASRGWRTVAGFQTRNPMHRAHEYLTKLALEITDGLVIHPLVGATKDDDVPAEVRLRCYEVLIERYYPAARTLLALFPAAMRYAGPREALFHAIVRKNYGITHLIVGRDHAGVGRYYDPLAAQHLFDRFPPGELGVTPLRLDATFFCRACAQVASLRTCPHEAAQRLELSGSAVRERLLRGEPLPAEFTRPEVAAVLDAHYRGTAAAPAPVANRGAVVWFTGLSGAGKSTLAQALRDELRRRGVRVEVLDGDEVRTNLCRGLGFSRTDRDENVRRIGLVARLLARQGVVAITAAISPYRESRDEVRAQAVAEGLPFIEVFADCPLAVLAARDVKGLYRRALAGELPHFTGVSDPYEPPLRPEVVVRSDRETPQESLARVLAALGAAQAAQGSAGPEQAAA